MNWIAFSGLLLTIILVAMRAERRMGKIESSISSNYGFIKAVARLTIKDEGTLLALNEGFMVRKSPARLNRDKLRGMVAKRGRPPEYVIDNIRKIALDPKSEDDIYVIGMVHTLFTSDQLDRAVGVHGGTIASSMAVFLQAIREARAEGVEHFLKDLNMVEG